MRSTSFSVVAAENDLSVLKILVVAAFDSQLHVSLVPKLNQLPCNWVPQIRTERGVLKGSTTVARYLASITAPSTNAFLLGRDKWEQAKVSEWIECLSSNLERIAQEQLLPRILKPERFENEEVFSFDDDSVYPVFARELFSLLGTLNTHLKLRTFLVGDQVTLADVQVVCALSTLFKFVVDEPRQLDFPHVTRHFVACTAMPQFNGVLGPTSLCKSSLWTALKSHAAGPKVDGERKQRHPLRYDEVPLPTDSPLSLPALTTDAGMDALEAHLSRRNFVFNGQLTKVDVSLHRIVQDALLHSTGDDGPRATPSRSKHPSVCRWFRHISRATDGLSRLALQRLPAPQPADLTVVQKESERATVSVPASEHPRLKDFFAQLARRAPRAQVHGRLMAQEKKMKRPFAPSILDTPDKLVVNDFEPMPYDGSDIFAPKPLKLLTSADVLAVLRNAHRKLLSTDEVVSELDLSVFLPAFKARKKGTKITGRRLLGMSRQALLALPGCGAFEDETDMLMAVVETLSQTGVEPVLLVKPKVEAEDLEELPPLEDAPKGPGWLLQQHQAAGKTTAPGDGGVLTGKLGTTADNAAPTTALAPIMSINYRPRPADGVTTRMHLLDGSRQAPLGTLLVRLTSLTFRGATVIVFLNGRDMQRERERERVLACHLPPSVARTYAAH